MSFFTSKSKSRSTPSYVRRAHHAGSWYSNNPDVLDDMLTNFLNDAIDDNLNNKKKNVMMGNRGDEDAGNDNGVLIDGYGNSSSSSLGLPRGIISPHAGFSYSGPTAAYAYLALKEFLQSALVGGSANDGDKTVTVVVLHPSHHVYLDGCAISGASMIETPLLNLPVDDQLRTELLNPKVKSSSSHCFSQQNQCMDQITDEEEHSGEMQYPFIAKVILDLKSSMTSMSTKHSTATTLEDVKVLPIMVGALSNSQQDSFGKCLSPFLSRSNIFTVISSDFCHWGKRFGYTPTPPSSTKKSNFLKETSSSSTSHTEHKEEIHQYIERLDHMGMDHISMQQPGAFATYMKQYKNTICGRHPIGVYLSAIQQNKTVGIESLDLTFVKYAQSSKVRFMGESSVSYASAVCRKRVA